MPQSQPTLPTKRAVVVQFRAQPSGPQWHGTGAPSMWGSGQVTHFYSLEE